MISPAAMAARLGGSLPAPGMRIGLLGGSFNPAHRWHREISLEAMRRLGLDQVWWLVSPQNPLKEEAGMAPLAERLATARRTADHPKILVGDLETLLGTTFTAETLKRLTGRLPWVRFVWLMGADNLIQLTEWKDWQEIFHRVVIAVFDRPTYSLRACRSKAARRFASRRIAERSARRLTDQAPPAWVFLHTRLSPLSATEIRARRKARGRPYRRRNH